MKTMKAICTTVSLTSTLLCAVMFIMISPVVGVEQRNEIIDSQNNNTKKLVELASAHIVSRAIHVAARIGVADYLVHGPCHIDDLALKTQTNLDALYRLLRLLASHGIFYEDEFMNFSLTPLAQLLVSGHPESLQAWLAHHDGDEVRWRSYGHMEYSIQTGKPAFNNIFGQGYFDFISQDLNMAKFFDEGMRNLSEKEEQHIVACYDFSSFASIVDIGGGKGGLLSGIIKKHPTISGIVYDLPHVEKSAQLYLFEQGCGTTITFESGSFFDAVPSGCDVYILKRILHDWDDELCIKILSNCRKAMKADSKLLIIEAIVAPKNVRDFAKDIDVAMLVLFGGKERTQQAWEQLLHAAGLQLLSIKHTQSMVSILEIGID